MANVNLDLLNSISNLRMGDTVVDPSTNKVYQDLLAQYSKSWKTTTSSMGVPADMQSAAQHITQANIRNVTLSIPQMKRIKLPRGVEPMQLLDILLNISSVQNTPGNQRIRFNKSEFEHGIKTLDIFEIIETHAGTRKYLSGFTQDTVDINDSSTYNFDIYPQLLGFSVVSSKYSENTFYKNVPNAILSVKRDGMNMLANVLPSAAVNNFLNTVNHYYYYDVDNSLYFEQKLLLHFTTSDIKQFNILKTHTELLEHIFAAAHLRLLASGTVNHSPPIGKDNRKLLDGLVSISNVGVQVDCDLVDTPLSVLRSSYPSRSSGIEITI